MELLADRDPEEARKILTDSAPSPGEPARLSAVLRARAQALVARRAAPSEAP